jgi:hypothetical protein
MNFIKYVFQYESILSQVSNAGTVWVLNANESSMKGPRESESIKCGVVLKNCWL